MKNSLPITDEEIAAALWKIELTVGPITQRKFCDQMGFTTHVIYSRFGGWQELRKVAGLPRSRPGKFGTGYTKDEIRNALKHVIETEGEAVTLFEFARRTGISQTAIARHFGSWTKLRAALNLAPCKTRDKVYSDEQIFGDISDLVGRLGRFPTSSDFERHGKFSIATYYRRGGSMREVRKAWAEYSRRKEFLRKHGVPEKTNGE